MAFLQRSGARRSRPQRTAKSKDGGLVRFILSVLLIGWIVRSFFVATFYIPSGSMVPTLYIGDYLFVAKWPYGYSRYSFPFGFPSFEGRIASHLPKRGDVVVFRHPAEDADLIKRVIGLPGDRIEVRGGRLILNGRPLERARVGEAPVPISPNSPCRRITNMGVDIAPQTAGQCRYFAYRETLPGGPSYTVLDQARTLPDDFPQITVPSGQLFVMGDNRDDSLDSRVSPLSGGVGFLPVDNLIGRAMVTVWSTDGSASYWKPWTWFTALRTDRLGNRYGETSK